MNDIQNFNFYDKRIRVVEINGEVWFIAKDVADILGYSNPRDAISRHVDKEDRNTVVFHDGTSGNPNVTTINESGVYSLIFSSKLPNAREFKHCVTSEILPTIRKTGGYVADEDRFTEYYLAGYPQEVKNLFKTTLKSMDYLNGEVKRLTGEVEGLNNNVKYLTEESATKDIVISQQTAEIEEAKPKVEFYDVVADSRENLTVAKYAKLLCKDGANVGQNRLFAWFRENGYLRQNNEPYQQYIDAGYFYLLEYTMYIKGNPVIATKTLITGKGQQYFYKKIMAAFGKGTA